MLGGVMSKRPKPVVDSEPKPDIVPPANTRAGATPMPKTPVTDPGTGAKLASTAPVPVDETRPKLPRPCPPRLANVPPTYTKSPAPATAYTAPLAFGFQVASATPVPVVDTLAIRLRLLPPIALKLPPT